DRAGRFACRRSSRPSRGRAAAPTPTGSAWARVVYRSAAPAVDCIRAVTGAARSVRRYPWRMTDDDRRTVSMVRPISRARRRAILEVLSGRSAGLRLELEGRARVGTRPFADLVIDDERVSGVHCEFIVAGDLRVRDLDSKNG